MEEDGALEQMDDEAQHQYDDSISAAETFMTRAKKLRAHAEKLRGFYKKGVSKNNRLQGAQE